MPGKKTEPRYILYLNNLVTQYLINKEHRKQSLAFLVLKALPYLKENSRELIISVQRRNNSNKSSTTCYITFHSSAT